MSTFNGYGCISKGVTNELEVPMLQIVKSQDLLINRGQGGEFQKFIESGDTWNLPQLPAGFYMFTHLSSPTICTFHRWGSDSGFQTWRNHHSPSPPWFYQRDWT